MTTTHEFSSLSAFAISEAIGCDYTGDCNPVDHDGTFYGTANWKEFGYADCVIFHREDNLLIVKSGTVNKLEGAEFLSALECSDITDEYSECKDESVKTRMEIEAALNYWGAYHDHDGEYYAEFTANQCDEEDAIWHSVEKHLRNLNN